MAAYSSSVGNGNGNGNGDGSPYCPEPVIAKAKAPLVEKNLLQQLVHANYENSGCDVNLRVRVAPFPVRSCRKCGDTHTPLWRNGPLGPKTLCNACGIRYRKEEAKLSTTLTLAPMGSSTQTPTPRR